MLIFGNMAVDAGKKLPKSYHNSCEQIHMTADTGDRPDDFNIARHDMINVLQALKLQYDLAMDAADKCKTLDVQNQVECLGCLDRALSSARAMGELAKRYTRLLSDMRNLACGKNAAGATGDRE
jgi:hypothetical protein